MPIIDATASNQMAGDREDAEDILNDALAFLGGEPVVNDDSVRYGPLTISVAAKVYSPPNSIAAF